MKGESCEGSGVVGMVCPEAKDGGWEEHQEDKLPVRNPAEGGVERGERRGGE